MINDKHHFFMERIPLNGGIRFTWAFESSVHPNKYSMVENMTIRTLKDTEVTKPFIDMPQQAAQSLMDELWHVGIRPSEGSGSAGSLAATEKHLEDMREIAFHKVGGDKP